MAKMASSPPHFWNGMSAWLEDPCCSGHTLQGRQHRIPSSRQRSRRRGEEAVESNRRAGPHACARLRRPGRAGTAPRPRPTLAQALEEASYDPPSSGALEPAGAAPLPALAPPAPCPRPSGVPRPAIEEGASAPPPRPAGPARRRRAPAHQTMADRMTPPQAPAQASGGGAAPALPGAVAACVPLGGYT